MSDLPEGVPESIFFQHSDGRVVELLGYRRRPDLSFGLPPRNRKGKVKAAGRIRRALVERDGELCHYCRVQMVMPQYGQAGNRYNNGVGDLLATIEHIVPRSQGGPNELYNLVLACHKCNNGFGDQGGKCECPFCQAAHNIFRSSNATQE